MQADISNWILNDGDNTHALDYDLNEDSIVMDLGGFKGVWVEMLLSKHKVTPNIYIIEPIPEFYNILNSKFKENNKIKILNIGVSVDSEDKDRTLYINGDKTSTNFKGGNSIVAKFNSLDTILKNNNIDTVDLIQINIEGDEYPLLEHLVTNDTIHKLKNIQIQYHLGIDGDVSRRKNIQKKLTELGFNKKFDYPFVWESWYKI